MPHLPSVSWKLRGAGSRKCLFATPGELCATRLRIMSPVVQEGLYSDCGQRSNHDLSECFALGPGKAPLQVALGLQGRALCPSSPERASVHCGRGRGQRRPTNGWSGDLTSLVTRPMQSHQSEASLPLANAVRSSTEWLMGQNWGEVSIFFPPWANSNFACGTITWKFSPTDYYGMDFRMHVLSVTALYGYDCKDTYVGVSPLHPIRA